MLLFYITIYKYIVSKRNEGLEQMQCDFHYN